MIDSRKTVVTGSFFVTGRIALMNSTKEHSKMEKSLHGG